MDAAKVSGTTAGTYTQQTRQTQTVRDTSSTREGKTLAEMIKDARDKIQANKDRLKISKDPKRYGDAPIEAYSRLSRAKTTAQVNAAAGYARRQIMQLRAAKRQDPDNAKRIQAAINQLEKAVTRSGKKKRDLEKEKVSEKRQARMAEEKREEAARRERQELRRRRTMRMLRESGYIREAEIDNRMQGQLSATRMELRNQAQELAAKFTPPVGAAEDYGAGTGGADAAPSGGGEIDLQA